MSALKSIRAFCLDCVGTANEVKLCPCTGCALYPYRFGHLPNREKKILTDEQKEKLQERLKGSKK